MPQAAIPAAIGAAGSILGGAIGSRGQKKAARAQADAQARAAAVLDERLSPFYGLGEQAVNPFLEAIGVTGTPQALPPMPQAFSGDALDNPALSFLRKEGLRKIREQGAGGGRNVDRDLAEYEAGLLSTIAPQLQAQQFGQQMQIRGAEQDARQQRVNNLLAALGIGQSSAARVGIGQAGMAQNVGSAQAASALGQAQSQQAGLGGLLQAGGALFGALGGGSGGGGGTPMGFNPNPFGGGTSGLNFKPKF